MAHFSYGLQGKVAFLEETLLWRPCGDPTYTFRGVERVVQVRLHACNPLAACRAFRAAEVEGAEHELLWRLRAKYGDATSVAEAPMIVARQPPRQKRSAPADQQSLF